VRVLVAAHPTDADLGAAVLDRLAGPLQGVADLGTVGTDTPTTGDDPGLGVAVVDAGTPAPLLDQLAAAGAAVQLVVGTGTRFDDLGPALDDGRLRGVVRWPCASGVLETQVLAQLRRLARDHAADDLAERLTVDGRGVDQPTSPVLRDLELGEHAIARRLLAAIDGALGARPRLHLPSGVRLTRQGDDVDAVAVVVRGSVALDRSSPLGDLRLHHASTGPVVGLLSLVQQRRAFFTARTTTDVELVHLTIEQLDLALRRGPEVAAALTAATVRALAGRLRRAEQLQLEKRQLARELDAERQRLADALEELEATRLDLLEAERLATLGELAAGVAHELNNPVAALVRAADFVRQDVLAVLADHPDRALLEEAVATAATRPPRSTADQRALRRELTTATGDAALADRLAAAGVDDPAVATAAARDRSGRALTLLETGHRLAGALRNLEVAGGRIAELVDSLRAYARPTSVPVQVDVAASLEDTLRVVAHRLEGVEVRRDYRPVPTVRAHPGQLGQVWSNLLTNAADAVEGSGTITIAIAARTPAVVEVRVTDDGPGLSDEAQARAFQPRFSTKQGTVRYGLGLGLAIARRIVEAHGGTITLTSGAGGTTASVQLPLAGPPDEPSTRREGG
jgi:two-component system NtrC family sensor kinase